MEIEAGHHPIGVVAHRTGLTPDVIRVWERRYGAVVPGRGEGGQRFYSDTDIRRLTLLRQATAAGRGIRQVARLDTEELARLVAADLASGDRGAAKGPPPDPGPVVAGALEQVRRLDGVGLDATLRRSAALLGIVPFLESVGAPLLRLVGDEWHAGHLTPAEEHLASAVLHDIGADMMRTLQPRDAGAIVVVATATGERHANGALAIAAAAAASGWRVVYLGPDLPAGDIAAAARTAHASLVAVSVTYVDDGDRVVAELERLRALVPATVPVWAGGAGAERLGERLEKSGIRVVSDLSALAAQRDRPIPG